MRSYLGGYFVDHVGAHAVADLARLIDADLDELVAALVLVVGLVVERLVVAQQHVERLEHRRLDVDLAGRGGRCRLVASAVLFVVVVVQLDLFVRTLMLLF